jgi:Lipocalin-like domain
MITQLPKLASNNRLKTTPAEDQAIAHGVLLFFGTYTVDEPSKSISLHIERSSFANQMRGELKRLLTVSGDDLTLRNASRAGGGDSIVKRRRIK